MIGTLVRNKIVDHSDVLHKDNCKARRETFHFLAFDAAYIRNFVVFISKRYHKWISVKGLHLSCYESIGMPTEPFLSTEIKGRVPTKSIMAFHKRGASICFANMM